MMVRTESPHICSFSTGGGNADTVVPGSSARISPEAIDDGAQLGFTAAAIVYCQANSGREKDMLSVQRPATKAGRSIVRA